MMLWALVLASICWAVGQPWCWWILGLIVMIWFGIHLFHWGWHVLHLPLPNPDYLSLPLPEVWDTTEKRAGDLYAPRNFYPG